ncbi:TonB-dependent receptor [Pontivivens ytuae]|uniref:TonB-dependent receptor n=1 Tax=Pontivivens ytuae TaxID=2789856 RepID=A0A7S9LUP7_9RHOB|nr:TonB-dependent receptor [Pontivivens ytuae]QPH55602.1 TonB-dependent receptor [Pontivivens ytuae]
MTRFQGLPATALAVLWGTTSVVAQGAEEPVLLDEVVIQALRTGGTESSIPGAVQVIEGEQVRQRIRQGRDLADVLGDLVPGLAPSNGTIGGASQTLRGRNTQILIDGVARTSELRGFDREFSTIDPNSIERIEVVKGSTARFGNGATGGIVNIVTSSPDAGFRTTIEGRLSTQSESDSRAADLFVAQDAQFGDFGVRVEASGRDVDNRFDGDGDRIPPDPIIGQGNADNLERYTLGSTLTWQRGASDLRLRLDAYELEQDIDFFTDYGTDPVSLTDRPYDGEPVRDEGQSASVRYSYSDTPIGEVELSAFVTDVDRRAAFAEPGPQNTLYYTTGPGSITQSDDAQTELFTTTYGASVTVRTPLDGVISGAGLTWGLDYARDDVEQELIDGTPIIAPMEQDSFAAFVQLEAPIGSRLTFSGGVRAERFDLTVEDFVRPDAAQLGTTGATALPALNVEGGEFDYDAVVGNAGLVFEATDEIDLYAGFSQGFSVPDVGAFTRRAVLPGALALAPGQTISFEDIEPDAQIVDTYQIGVRFDQDAISVDASAFFSTSDEGVTFDSATNELSQQKEEIYGAEISLSYAVRPAWLLGAELAYIEGEFDDDDDGSVETPLPNNRIPAPFTATLSTDYLFANGASLLGELVYASGRDEGDEPELDDMVTVNFGGAYPVGTGDITFGISNLFDRQQDNNTASSVRTDPLTGGGVYVADEGRRFSLGYSATF